MGERIYCNNDWKFSESFQMEMTAKEYGESKMQPVRLPHTCKETPFHYFDEQIYQMVSCYRRELNIPYSWQGKCILLTFEGVAHSCEVFVNGKKVGEHHCGYTAFTIDISKALCFGEANVLTVRVDSRESLNVPPFGHVIDYMTYGGIYRDVYLEVKEAVHLEDIFLHTEMEGAKSQWKVSLVTSLRLSRGQTGLTLCQQMRKKGSGVWQKLGEDIALDKEKEIQFSREVQEAELWEIDHPALYEVKTQLYRAGQMLDEKVTVFGFRKAEFKKDGFYLNEKKVKLRGLNRHQSYPYVGYAMPKSMQMMDADILKKELYVNAVRTSHYPQSHYFLDRCDELGLLVFTEIPGWQYIGDEVWKQQAIRNVEEMVLQYRNHPSIVLWGVRINESADDDEFYRRTNEAARRLDPYRQTGGVRAHKNSSLLEDVYTYNDFSHDGKNRGCEPKKKVTSDEEKPYLISEYNGHMYPTKAFDWEEHRVWHALRHANVLDAVAGQEDIAGSFGWCMADYNTHKDFGSGDRICYHGVLDMFRNPKLAADIYACQQDKEPVLSVSSTMDIGEHPGCNRGKTFIFFNAEKVRMYKNDRLLKEYTRENSSYQNLLHGPIEMDDYIGDAIEEQEHFTKKQAGEIKAALNYVAANGFSHLPKRLIFTVFKMIVFHHMKPSDAVTLYNRYIGDWGGAATVYRFEAVSNGNVVKEAVKKPMTAMQLWAQADHTNLQEEHTYDVAAVRIRMLDENGNLLVFYNEPVQLEIQGPISLIGDKVISLKGGMCGTYVKTMGEAGEAVLTLKSGQAKTVRIAFTIQISQEQKE